MGVGFGFVASKAPTTGRWKVHCRSEVLMQEDGWAKLYSTNGFHLAVPASERSFDRSQ